MTRDVKLPLYARHGFAEIWMVDIESGKLTTYTQPEADRYAKVDDPADWNTVEISALGITVDLSSLF